MPEFHCARVLTEAPTRAASNTATTASAAANTVSRLPSQGSIRIGVAIFGIANERIAQ
jgi:hypothetical protein